MVVFAAESRGASELVPSPTASNLWPIISLAIGLAITAMVIATRAMKLSGAPRSAWLLSSGASLVLFMLLLGVGPQGGAALAALLSIAPDETSLRASVIHASGTFALQMLLLAALFTARRGGMIRGQHEFDSATGNCGAEPFTHARAVALAAIALALAWFPLQAVGTIASSIQLSFGGAVPPLEGHSTFELLRTSPNITLNVAMIVVVLAFAPIAEELAFRGGLLRALRGLRGPPWLAIAITSLLFAAVHVPALTAGAMASGLATLFTLAVILGWLMERTGRITAPIVAHALFNLINLILFWTA